MRLSRSPCASSRARVALYRKSLIICGGAALRSKPKATFGRALKRNVCTRRRSGVSIARTTLKPRPGRRALIMYESNICRVTRALCRGLQLTLTFAACANNSTGVSKFRCTCRTCGRRPAKWWLHLAEIATGWFWLCSPLKIVRKKYSVVQSRCLSTDEWAWIDYTWSVYLLFSDWANKRMAWFLFKGQYTVDKIIRYLHHLINTAIKCNDISAKPITA